MAASDWIEQKDEHGNVYYYNTVTQESSWEAPEAIVKTSDGEAKIQEWMKQYDENGNLYYYNTSTGVSTWEKPEGFDDGTPKWSKVFDPSTNSWYYYNNHNGQYQWEKPDDFEEFKAGEQKLPENLLAIIKIQSQFRAKLSRKKSRIQRAANLCNTTGAVSKWTATLDPSSGYHYYYNRETGECVWDCPPDYDGEPVGAFQQEKEKENVHKTENDDDGIKTDLNNKKTCKENEEKSDPNTETEIETKEAAADSTQLMKQDEINESGEINLKAESFLADEHASLFDGESKKKVGAAIMLQCAFRVRRAKKSVLAKRGYIIASEGDNKGNIWTAVLDPASDCYYYYNNETEECTWNKPKELEEDIDNKENISKSVDKTEEKDCSPWQAVLDTESGEYYYYNKETKETTWEKPDALLSDKEIQIKAAEVTALPEWVEVFDPSSKCYYYYNNISGETTWEMPENFEKPDLTKLKNLFSPELKAAIMLQCAFRARKARHNLRAQRGANNSAEGQVWTEILDPSTRDYYYYNNQTEEVTWDKPEELMTEEEKKQKESQPEWLSTLDEESGETYYYNTETGDVQWERPECFVAQDEKIKQDEEIIKKMKMALEGKLRKIDPTIARKMKEARSREKSAKEHIQGQRWCEAYDNESGEFYYYNVDTHEVTWDKPENFILEASDELLHAALTIQSLFRAKIAQKQVRKMKGEKATHLPENKGKVWVSVTDDDNNIYYYNVHTSNIAWELTDTMIDANKASASAQKNNINDPEPDLETETETETEKTETVTETETENISELTEAQRSNVSSPQHKVLLNESPQVESQVETPVQKEQEPAENHEIANDVLHETEISARTEPPEDHNGKAFEKNEENKSKEKVLEEMNREKLEMEREMERIQKERVEAKILARKKAKQEKAQRELEKEYEKKKRNEKKLKESREEILIERKRLQAQRENEKNKRIKSKMKSLEKFLERQEITHREEEIQKENEGLLRAKEREQRKTRRKKEMNDEMESNKSEYELYRSMLEKENKRLEEERRGFVSLCNHLNNESALKENMSEESSRNQGHAGASIWDIVCGNLFPGARDIDCLRIHIEEEIQSNPRTPELESSTLFLRNENGESLLHIAGTLGNLDLIKALFEINEKLSSAEGFRCRVVDARCIDNAAKLTTALHEVARSGWGENIVNILIESGANVDERDFHGDTPLHCAVRNGHCHTVKSLLKVDKDLLSLTTKNDKSRTPLDLAKLYHLREITKHDKNPSYGDIVEILQEYMQQVKDDKSKTFFQKKFRRKKIKSNSNSSSLLSEYATIKSTKKKSIKPTPQSKDEFDQAEAKEENTVLQSKGLEDSQFVLKNYKPNSTLKKLKTVKKINRMKRASGVKKQQLFPLSPQQKKKGLRKLKSISSLRSNASAFNSTPISKATLGEIK